MKKAILVLFVLGFVGMNGYAQKVYKGADGKVYLDCTVASGMPAGSVTTTPKCLDGIASNSTFRDGSTTTNPYAWENDKVFEKLEIDASDLDNTTMNWETAYSDCKKKGTGWRLPTQRELMLMYIFRAQLGSLTGKAFTNGAYLSSSEYNIESCWYVDLTLSFTHESSKTTNPSGFQARCVREVTP